MIEIASPATPQLASLLLRIVRPRRWRSPNCPSADSPEHGRREKHHPSAGRQHALATLYPSKSSSIAIATTRQQPPATLKSP
jgi:hypothetical protein